MYGRGVTDTPERLEWPQGQEPEPSFGSHMRQMEQQIEKQPEKEPEKQQYPDLSYC